MAPTLARDHHVLALDQRGHGDSDWAPRYDREAFTGDIGAVLDAHGWEAATLIALSLGGLNAIAFAARHPERVRGLVVVDVVPSVAPAGRDAIGRQLAVRDFDTFDEAVAHARAFNPRRTRRQHPRAPAPRHAQGTGRPLELQVRPGPSPAARASIETLWWAVGRLRCPTTAGARRREPDPHRRGRGALRPQRPAEAPSAVVPGAGHSVMGDNPAGFLAAVRPFLARHGL